MKRNALHSAMTLALFAAAATALPVQAGPRDPAAHQTIEPIMRLQPVASSADTVELLIYGYIGDSWYEESTTALSVAKQLAELADTVTTIRVRINSYGGSVADGLAIYNALDRHKATVEVIVDGVAMSSASLIAMAGDSVSMPETSLLMIHAPWGGVYGNAKEVRQYADVLDKFSASMVGAYTKKSGMDHAEALALLTDGEDHYYTGEEAIAAGFADAIAKDTDAEESDTTDESASAFANALLGRIAASASPKYAGLAVAAALRGARGQGARSGAKPPTNQAPKNPPAQAEHTTPAPAGNKTGVDTVTEEEKKAAALAALQADGARRSAIRAHFAPFVAKQENPAALAKLQDECENDHSCDEASAQTKLLAFLGKDAAPLGSRVEAGRQDETDTYRAGATAALLHRWRPDAVKLDEKSRPFVGMNLLDLARDTLARASINVRGMTRQEIAVRALQSTSDLPFLLENSVGKTLRMGYAASARTFLPFCRQGTLPDFKEVSRVQISGAPSLQRIRPGEEYEYGNIGEGAEKIRLLKYGRLIGINWEAIVNDDLDAITRIPFAFGASAGDLESDIVYAILTGNPVMADTVALFHATHGNLGTAGALLDAIHPSPDTPNPLAQMRAKMLLQKGIEGRYITVRPKFLIVPPSLEEAALKVTSATVLAARGADVNVVGPSLTPIVEPRLEDTSATGWYGAATPDTVDTIEYAYLEGQDGVFTETKNGFEVDGVAVKCRHVVGAKAIDWRGLFKNAGAAPTAWPAP